MTLWANWSKPSLFHSENCEFEPRQGHRVNKNEMKNYKMTYGRFEGIIQQSYGVFLILPCSVIGNTNLFDRFILGSNPSGATHSSVVYSVNILGFDPKAEGSIPSRTTFLVH